MAEISFQILKSAWSIFHDIVKQARTDCIRIHSQLYQDGADCQGVDYVGLTALSLLISVKPVRIRCRGTDLLLILNAVLECLLCEYSL